MSETTGTSRRKGRGLLALLFGVIVGAAGALFLPHYFPALPWGGTEVEGMVIDKQREPERLLLRLSTNEGMLLATFTEKLADIDLLVQRGDGVVLRVSELSPFLDDPTIKRVNRSDTTVASELESVQEPKPEKLSEPASKTPPEQPLPAEDESTAEKEGYLESMASRLRNWKSEIESLRGRSSELGDDLRADATKRLADLDEKVAAASEGLAALRESSGDAWDEIKEGLDAARAEIEAALQEAAEAFTSDDE